MVAAARAVTVEIGFHDAVGEKPFSGGRIRLDRTRGRDVVGGDRIPEHAEHARALDVGGRVRLHLEAIEERRLGNVGRRGPAINLARRALDRAPQRIGRGEAAVELAKRRGIARERQHLGNFARCRPHVLQENRLAVAAGAERLGRQIAQHRACDGVGDHQRRRRQEIRLEIRVDACFEIAIAGQHSSADQVVAHDGVVEFRSEVAGVADARRAAIRGEAEAQLLEIGQEPRARQVVGDDTRAGCQRCLDVALDGQAALDGFLGQESGCKQHTGIRRVRTRRDRRDQHVAVAE